MATMPPPLARRYVTVQPYPTLVCPQGHRIPGLGWSLQEAVFTCRHRLANGAMCDCSMYVVTDWRGDGEERLSLVVKVSRTEIEHMRRMPMREKLAYLGLTQEVRRADQAR